MCQTRRYYGSALTQDSNCASRWWIIMGVDLGSGSDFQEMGVALRGIPLSSRSLQIHTLA